MWDTQTHSAYIFILLLYSFAFGIYYVVLCLMAVFTYIYKFYTLFIALAVDFILLYPRQQSTLIIPTQWEKWRRGGLRINVIIIIIIITMNNPIEELRLHFYLVMDIRLERMWIDVVCCLVAYIWIKYLTEYIHCTIVI